MTLEALEFPEAETTDPPELVAFKAKVVEVAKEYKKIHGWCGEVDRALRDMGITEPPKECTVHVGVADDVLKFAVKAQIADLKGKTAKQQAAHIAGLLDRVAVGGRVEGRIQVTSDKISSMTLVPPPAVPAAGLEVDGEFTWGYVSNAARVLHKFRTDQVNRTDRVYNAWSACTRWPLEPYATLHATSARGTGVRCTGCENYL